MQNRRLPIVFTFAAMLCISIYGNAVRSQDVDQIRFFAIGGIAKEGERGEVDLYFPQRLDLSRFSEMDMIQSASKIDLTFCTSTDEFLVSAFKSTELRGLDLTASDVKSAFIETEDFPLLSFLSLQYTSIENFGFLTRLPSLKYLNLGGTCFRDKDISDLAELKLLSHLDLSGTEVSFDGIVKLVESDSLEELVLIDCGICDSNYKRLLELKSRPTLILGSEISDGPWVGLGSDLSGESIRDLENHGFEVIGKPSQEHRFRVVFKGNEPVQMNLKIDELDSLANPQDVDEIYLTASFIDDTSAAVLARFENVRVVSLAGTRVTDRVLGTLCKLKHLQTLDVSNCRISDFGFSSEWSDGQQLEVLIADDTYVVGICVGLCLENVKSLSILRTASARWRSVINSPSCTPPGIQGICASSEIRSLTAEWDESLDRFGALNRLSNSSLEELTLFGITLTERERTWFDFEVKDDSSFHFFGQ